eukprot:NODE_4105_length_842_cov_3.168979_g3397_i0.p2 GENE.NODE_4105_length_842_cov_3.168979_g3397_i0~~NODE_4105_length_842_cov_3.168979_g3397_i0.p2  ORF type:complete len:68 (-),score=2.69 NODE_4105_length_842_cov_3.168979_g3397_i0:255-458(-)
MAPKSSVDDFGGGEAYDFSHPKSSADDFGAQGAFSPLWLDRTWLRCTLSCTECKTGHTAARCGTRQI